MTTPAHDLSRLRIDRDPPPEVRRAFGRTVLLAGAALIVIAAAILYNRSRSAPRVTTVVATAAGGAGQAGTAAGATLVTANGYVVARTRASVAASP